ncbi:DUF4412 domain-containing protein [uncultured Maribacter sp.]|uniref:DUF4412 domain-containing protein n=1 Tax=uncultured Maribacter sp. TaxID=431308 RepID=UPI0030EC2896|tara:strand:- start:33839 stop:34654 length:816 start_codon:yes stop_codon:yes gene_type:complete
MKTFKLLTLLFAFGITTNSSAQFFKNLKKRAQEAAEQTIERKVAEKTERETEKSFDTVFNNKGRVFKNGKVEKADTYNFSHQYIMEIISDKDTTDITYYLTNENEYMGSSFSAGKDQEFITVMDLPNSAIHTFMDMGGQRTMNSMHIDLEDSSDLEMNSNEYSISPTGQTKKIIGYECDEYQMTGPQVSGTVWVTQEADISFQKAFTKLKTKKIKSTKGMDQSWVSMVDGLTLEMKMIDYSRKKPKPITMVCTNLSEHNFSINTLEYEKPF